MDESGITTFGDLETPCTIDEYIEILFGLLDQLPPHMENMPAFEAALRLLRPQDVCCTGILLNEPWLNMLIGLESTCSEYHVLPYEGGLFEQPQYIFDSFNAIRAARNEYHRISMEETMSKAKAKSEGVS